MTTKKKTMGVSEMKIISHVEPLLDKKGNLIGLNLRSVKFLDFLNTLTKLFDKRYEKLNYSEKLRGKKYGRRNLFNA